MIQQQCYTRYKRGLYSNNPGFDTVAKSKGLEDEFVKNVLHPLCVYEPPVELIGEEDVLKYPKALYCVNYEEALVIGQAAFCGKDYSGNRNTYFVHNYIIPEKEKFNYIDNSNKIIYMNDFKVNWNFDFEKDIKEILETSYDKKDELNLSFEELKTKLKIQDERFKELILACKKAAQYNEKIYVIFDIEVSFIDKYAREVLKYIYRELPYDTKEKFGFITYTKTPISIENVNIMFLPKGSIKRLSTEIKAGYLFDFAENRFYLDELEDDERVIAKSKNDNEDLYNKENKFIKFFNKILNFLRMRR